MRNLPSEAQRVVQELQKHPKVVAVFLFGSWARGETTPLSDVDLAVLLREPTPADEVEVGSLGGPRVDVVLFHRLPLHVQHEVLREGKELFVRDRAFLEEVYARTVHRYLEMSPLYRALTQEVLGRSLWKTSSALKSTCGAPGSS